MRGGRKGGAGAWALCALAVGLPRRGLAEGGTPDALRGVAPADLPKYRPHSSRDGSATFRCFDSGGSAEAPELPYAAVNDDSCDCADGSDEPGTDACAGQSQTLFFCRNERSDAAYVYASRVNDGICDCCDGSDEWRAVVGKGPRLPCRNTCLEEGQKLGEERAQREAELRGGVERRRALAAAAAEERRALQEELKALDAELPALEARESKAKKELDRAERLGKKEEPAVQAKEAQSAEEPVVPEPPVEAAPAVEERAGGEAPVVSEYAKWMEGAGEALDAGGGSQAAPQAAPSEPAPSEAVVSEYAKWMENADKALEAGGDMAKAGVEPPPRVPTPAPTLAPAPARGSEVKREGFFARQWRKVSEAFDGLWHKEPPPPLQEAQQAHTDAEDKLTKSRDRRREVEKKLGHMTNETTLAYSNLVDRCLSLKAGEYDYRVCFFDRATQDGQSSMLVGSWGRWEAPGVALFEKGEMCPGGPARSLRVLFRCGSSEELLDVAEPSRCAYEAHASHPAACTEEQLEALLTRGPRRPTDEL